MISVAEVQFREKGRPLQMLKGSRHQWQMIRILHLDVVQPSVVNTGTKRPLFLFHKKTPAPTGEEEG